MGCCKSKRNIEETNETKEINETREIQETQPTKEDDLEKLSKTTFYKKEELKTWHKDFIKDYPHGKLNKEQFSELYDKLYFTESKSADKIDVLFSAFDSNGNGEIDFNELMMNLSLLKRGPMKEKMTWLFNIYDIDGSGQISLAELLRVVNCLRNLDTKKGTSFKYNEQYMSQVFNQMDLDFDGFLSVDEFIKGVQNYPELVTLLSVGQTLPLL